jgi:hypothetical protein
MNSTELLAEPLEFYLTDEASKRLRRKPQTLRKWACTECGPIRPVRVGGRLLWRRSDIELLLSGGLAAR